MCFFGAVAHQSSMQELDLLNPQLDPRISYTGGPKMFVGPAGLLQESPGNYLLWSEDFSNAAWVKDQATVVANAAIGPFGGATADKLIPSTTNTFSHRVYQDVTTAAIAHTDSVYAKAAGYAVLSLTNYSGRCTVNLADGSVIETSGAPEAFTVTPAPNGYWRIEIAKTPVAGVIRTQIAIYATPDRASYSGDGVSGVLVCAAMKNKGATAAAYLATTSAPAYDWPLEYDPVTLKPIGRSVWEQRINKFQRSEEFDNTFWSKVGGTVTPNAAIGPDGNLSMDLLVEDTSNLLHNITCASATVTVGGFIAISVFAKKAGRDWLCIDITSSGGNGARAFFNMSTGAKGSGTTLGTGTYVDHLILPTGVAGIYRCILIGKVDAAAVSFATNFRASTDGVSLSFVGLNAGALYLFGAQFEEASFAGPYIPTAGSQVTRAADLATFSRSGIRYNAAGMSFLIDVIAADGTGTQVALELGDGTNSNRILLWRQGTVLQISTRSSGGNSGDLSAATPAASNSTRYRLASAFRGNDLRAARDGGTAVGPDATADWPAGNLSGWIGRTGAGGGYLNSPICTVRFYPAPVVNSELQALTA